MLPINKENATVTMSLIDYEALKATCKDYYELFGKLRALTRVVHVDSESATVVINKEKAEKLLIPFAETDCEFDGIEDSVKVVWE